MLLDHFSLLRVLFSLLVKQRILLFDRQLKEWFRSVIVFADICYSHFLKTIVALLRTDNQSFVTAKCLTSENLLA